MWAAAQREHVAQHPVLDVQCVQTYLRQHHTAVTNLRGLVTSPSLVDARGAVGPDFATQALLGPGPSVQLHNLDSGQLLRQWALPDVSSPFRPEQSWGWPAGSYVVLPFGNRWHTLRHSPARKAQPSGLVFLDTETGGAGVWHLPTAQLGHTWAFSHFCPGRGMVLVQHSSSAGQPLFSVFTSQGVLIQHMVQHGIAPLTERCWAPGRGNMIAFRDSAQSMFLWPLTADAVLQEAQTGHGCHIAWGTPFSGRLIALSHEGVVTVVSLGLPVQVLSHRLPGSILELGWGIRLVCFEGNMAELHIHSLQGTCLTIERVIGLRSACYSQSALQMSSCGELCAGVTAIEGARGWVRHQLFIVQLTTGHLVQLPVQDTSGVARWHWRWAEDSSALLVTQLLGCSQLFRLAE